MSRGAMPRSKCREKAKLLGVLLIWAGYIRCEQFHPPLGWVCSRNREWNEEGTEASLLPCPQHWVLDALWEDPVVTFP